MSGINKAAKLGIIVKSGATMEQIGKAKAVVFDKTGTITFGTPVIEKIVTIGNVDSQELLLRAASLEQLSSHPAAAVLVQKAQEKFKLFIPTNFYEIAGAGVEGDINGEHIIVGSQSIFKNIGYSGSIERILDLKNKFNHREKWWHS